MVRMTARTKAAKRAAKRGRPTLPADSTSREPNGRLSRRAARVRETENETREHVARIRMRHFNIQTVEQATDPRSGYVLGRMLLDGTVNAIQHEAGNRYAEDMARYYGLTGVQFPSARAQNLFSVRASGGEDSQTRADAAKEARARAGKLQSLLLASGDINTGRRVEHTVKLICIQDVQERRHLPPNMVEWLKRGLNSLALYYGVSSLKA